MHSVDTMNNFHNKWIAILSNGPLFKLTITKTNQIYLRCERKQMQHNLNQNIIGVFQTFIFAIFMVYLRPLQV